VESRHEEILMMQKVQRPDVGVVGPSLKGNRKLEPFSKIAKTKQPKIVER